MADVTQMGEDERRLAEMGYKQDLNRSWSGNRSEEHTSELQSPVVISYAVFCLDRKSVV